MLQLVDYRVDLEGVEQVEWYGCQQVKQEPSANVVERYLSRVVDHLTTLADVRRAKVEHDICASTHKYAQLLNERFKDKTQLSLCLTVIVLLTKLSVQCDQLAKYARKTLKTLATVDVPWHKKTKIGQVQRDWVSEENAVISKNTRVSLENNAV